MGLDRLLAIDPDFVEEKVFDGSLNHPPQEVTVAAALERAERDFEGPFVRATAAVRDAMDVKAEELF